MISCTEKILCFSLEWIHNCFSKNLQKSHREK